MDTPPFNNLKTYCLINVILNINISYFLIMVIN